MGRKMTGKRKEDDASWMMKAINSVKTLWFALVIGFSGMAWASDVYHSQYLKVSVYHASELRKERRDLINEIADLEIDLENSINPLESKGIRKKLIRKKAQIRNLKVH